LVTYFDYRFTALSFRERKSPLSCNLTNGSDYNICHFNDSNVTFTNTYYFKLTDFNDSFYGYPIDWSAVAVYCSLEAGINTSTILSDLITFEETTGGVNVNLTAG
jgi:hypothetical protein